MLVGLAVIAIAAVAVSLGSGSGRSPRRATTEATLAPASTPPWLGSRRTGRLRVPVQDSAAVPIGGASAAVLGGLDQSASSRTMIERVSGASDVSIGQLPTPLHDAAAASVDGSVYLFGGGQAASADQIYRVDPHTGASTQVGRLPQPQSDLAAATVAGTVYLVGGYTGSTPLDTILAWRPGGQPATLVARLPHPLRYAAVAATADRIIIAGGTTPRGATHTILSFDPRTGTVRKIGLLPAATTHAAAAALGGWIYVIGGRRGDAGTPSSEIVAVNPKTGKTVLSGRLPLGLSDAAAIPLAGSILLAGGRSSSGVVGDLLTLAPAPRPAADVTAARMLRPGSDPSVLPGNVLIADKANNRLLEVTPAGQIVWSFPGPGERPSQRQSFQVPDDAFYTRDGSAIVATQEDDFTISVLDRGTGRILYRAGKPGVPGVSRGLLHNPDDAMMLGNGRLIAADIKNCRLIELTPPSHRVTAQLGTTASCYHDPPASFGSPNGAFPTTGGGVVVTEINGDWIDVFDRHGHLVSTANPPGFSYPSDTNEVKPGLYLSVDYAQPGAVETFDAGGKLRWRFAPTGAEALNHPSLALPLPGGDVLVNDDYNDRVIVIDPHTNRIVWQYGHTGVAGSGPGYLHIPDGVDLAPPYALMDRFRKISGLPRR